MTPDESLETIKRWTAVVRMVAIAYSAIFGAWFLYALDGGHVIFADGTVTLIRLPVASFQLWELLIFLLIIATPWGALECLKLKNDGGTGLAFGSCFICVFGIFTLPIGIIAIVASLKIWAAAETIWNQRERAVGPQHQL